MTSSSLRRLGEDMANEGSAARRRQWFCANQKKQEKPNTKDQRIRITRRRRRRRRRNRNRENINGTHTRKERGRAGWMWGGVGLGVMKALWLVGWLVGVSLCFVFHGDKHQLFPPKTEGQQQHQRIRETHQLTSSNSNEEESAEPWPNPFEEQYGF